MYTIIYFQQQTELFTTFTYMTDGILTMKQIRMNPSFCFVFFGVVVVFVFNFFYVSQTKLPLESRVKTGHKSCESQMVSICF